MTRFATLALVGVACSAPATPPPDPPEPVTAAPRDALPGAGKLDALAWLAGTYRVVKPNAVIEESWTDPGGGTMFGVSRTIADGKLAEFEWLRIDARDDGIVYTAHPGGRMPGTEFRLRPRTEGPFVFENLAHDFPQRLVYTRGENGSLTARAENDEHALTFEFHRVP